MAVSVAMRRSHQSASSRPPARQKPEIAAIVGLGGVSRVNPIGPSAELSRSTNVSVALRSAPAQNETSPAPVSTSTRAPASSAKRTYASCSAAAVGPSTALRLCWRSIVIRAALPRRL